MTIELHPIEWNFNVRVRCSMLVFQPTSTMLDVTYEIYTGMDILSKKHMALTLSNIEFDEDPERTWMRWEESFFQGMQLMLKEHRAEIVKALEPAFRELEEARWRQTPPDERIRHEKHVLPPQMQ